MTSSSSSSSSKSNKDDKKKKTIIKSEKNFKLKSAVKRKNGRSSSSITTSIVNNSKEMKKQQMKNKDNNNKNKKHTTITSCRFVQCANDNQHTNSIFITKVPMEEEEEETTTMDTTTKKKKKKKKKKQRRMTQVMTCTTFPPSSSSNHNDNTMEQQPQQQLPQVVRIYVKPLIILDLNGVLCHRVRTRNNSPYPKNNKWYRPSIGRIAMTPIIARTDLIIFLEQLCQNFTMAVWTSAKRRNALELVKLLFPPHISQQLLFIWAQNKCQSIPRPNNQQPQQQPLSVLSNPYKDDIIFTKRLSKVWEDYPLWNSTNTLLIDDSPDKCPNEYVNNALHPPPLTGFNKSSTQALTNDDDNDDCNDDEINEELQRTFFHKLAMHWTTNPTNGSPHNKNDETMDNVDDNSSLRSFLKQHGSLHMGWRGETKLLS